AAGGAESALVFALDSQEARMVRAAFATLERHRGEYAVPRIAAIARESKDRSLRTDAVRTLGRIGGQAAMTELFNLSSDRQLREAVVDALAGLDTAETVRLL